MIKVKNLYTAIEQTNKSGKLIKRTQIENRLLDNYLDYMIYRILPKNIGDALFPDIAIADDDAARYINLPYVYIRANATQALTDASVSMLYDAYQYIYNIPLAMPNEFLISEETGANNKTFTFRYLPLTLTLTNSDLIYQLGFGIEDVYTNWLMSYLDVSASNIIFNSENTFNIIRSDYFETDEILLEGEAMNYLPGYQHSGTLYSIIVCYGENGATAGQEYLVDDLTFTYISAGKVEISGFNNFHIETNVLYPGDTTYPSDTTYPTQEGEKIKSIIFKYLTYNRDIYSAKYEQIEFIKTYININDLSVSYEDKEIKINLIVERG